MSGRRAKQHRRSASRDFNRVVPAQARAAWKDRLTAAGLITGVLMPFVPTSALALPQGGNVTSGAATISTPTGTSMRIDQTTDRLIVDWTRFNIAANESVRFQQPSAASIALNRVLGPEPSAIFGSLSANGQIFLINPSGILFGSGSRVDVGALTASTLTMRNQDFLAGQYRFTQDPALGNAAVVNQGVITAGPGGYVALLGAATRNEGVIQAQLGSIALAAGKAATLDMRGDGLIQFVVSDAVAGNVISPDGKPLASYVSNTGTLQADGGMVTLQAKAATDVIRSVVNQEGIVRATSLMNRGGVITLIADGDHATVSNSGILDVSAGESHATPGAITVHSDGAVSLGGTVTAGAGAIVLAAQNLTLQGAISTAGEMTVNAGNVTIADGSVHAASGAITVSGNVTQTGGTFAPGAATITVGGNWTHAGGSFDPGTSTVDFNDATQSSTILGDNTFYNLTSVTPDKWLFLEAGATQTVLNNVTLQGARFHLLHLRSTDPGGVQWRLDPRGAVDVNFVFLGDAFNVSPRVIKTLPSNSYGNNTGWDTDPTWNGLGADNDWTTIGNWDTGVVPIATDTVSFDATSTKNSTVNAGFAGTIGNLSINTGYTGTITMARSLTINGSYTQAAGTFTAGSNALTINGNCCSTAGNFTLSGGTFNAPSGTFTYSDPWGWSPTFTISGGTFNHNSGTLLFTNEYPGYVMRVDVPSSVHFNNVTVDNSGSYLAVASGKTLTVDGTLTLTSGALSGSAGSGDGTLDAKGPVLIGAAFQGSFYGHEGTTVLIDGTGDQSFVVPAGATLPRLILNSGLTTISFAGDATINGDFTLQAGTFTAPSGTLTVTDATTDHTVFSISGGTFNHNNGTVQFTGYYVEADVPASVHFNNVTVAMNSGYLFYVTHGQTLTVDGTLTLTSGYLYGFAGSYDGTLDAKGPVSIGAAFQGSYYGHEGTTVLIDGAGDQSFVVPAGATLPRMILNSGLTTMSFAGDATINGDFTLQAGTFTAPSGTLTVTDATTDHTVFSISGGTFNHNNGTVQFTGYYVHADVPASVHFNNVTVAMNSGYLFYVTHGQTLTVDGTLTLTSGYLAGTVGAGDGTLDAKGPVSIGAGFLGNQYGNQGTTVLIDGAGDQSFVVPAGATLPRMILNSGLTTISFAGDATINGDFTLQAGTFTAPSGTLTVTDPSGNGVTVTMSGGTFNHNNGTVQFTGYYVHADVPASVHFNNVTVAMNSGYLFYVTHGQTLTVDGTLTLTSGYLAGTVGAGDGTLDAKGPVSIGAGFLGNQYGNQGTTVLIDGTGDQSFVVPAGATLPRMILNSGLTTISFAGDATINGDFTLQAGTFTAPSGTLTVTDPSGNGVTVTMSSGTFNHNNGTVQFTGYYDAADVPASAHFNNVTVASSRLYVAQGKTLTVDGTLTLTSGYLAGSAGYYDGTLDAKGPVSIGAGFLGNQYGNQGTAVLMDGAGAQSLTVAAGATLPRMTLNNANITTSFAGDATINGDFTLQAGTFTAPSGTLTVTDPSGNGVTVSLSGGTFNHNNGTVQFTGYYDAADVPASAHFNNVTVALTDGYPLTIASGKTLVVNGTFTHTDGVINTGTIAAQGNVIIGAGADGGTAVLQFTGGNAQTYTDNGGTKTTGNVTVNKTVGSAVTLATDMSYNSAGQTLTVTSGTLDVAGHNLTVNDALTVAAAGMLQLQGAETISAGTVTLNAGSTVRYYGTAPSYTLKDYAYSNLTIDGGAATVFSFPANLTSINTLTLNNSITSLAGFNLTATTLVNNATLRLQGNETVTLINGNDTAEGTWEYVGDGVGGLTSFTIKDFGATDYYNLTINSTEGSAESFSLGAALTVVGAFTHSAGTLTAGASGIDLTAGSVTTSAPVIATAGGSILITTDTIDLAGAAGTISGTGALTLQPATAARPIVLGAAGTASDFALSTTELATLANGFSSITIGRANSSGGITVNAVTFNDPVTLRSPSGSTIHVNGQITGADNASVTITGTGTTTHLAADIVTAGNAITINDALSVDATATLDTTNAGGSPAGANISVTGTTNADLAASARNLTLTAGTAGNVSLTGAVGGTQPLKTLTVTSANSATLPAIITRDGGISVTATAITLNGDLSTNSTATAGAVVLAGPVTLTNNTTITTDTTTDANITFSSTINGAHDLTLTADAGNVLLSGIVGGSQPLTSFTINSANSASLPVMTVNGALIDRATITTLNGNLTETFTSMGPVVLAATVTVNAIGDDMFLSTFDGAHALTLQAGGDIHAGGAIGGTTRLTSLTVLATGGYIDLPAVNTTGAQSYNSVIETRLNGNLNSNTAGAITVTGAANLTTGAIAVQTAGLAATDDITFTSTINGNQDLTLTAGAGDVLVSGPVGGSQAVNTFTVTNANTATLPAITTRSGGINVTANFITLNGNLSANAISTAGPVALTGAITLGADVTITTDAATTDANITLSGQIDGAHALTLNAGSSNITVQAASRSFDGVGNYVLVNSTFGLGTGDATIGAWVNLDSASRNGAFVKIGTETDVSGGDGYAIGVGGTTFDNTGNHLIVLYEGVRWINTNVNIGTGWHHVAVTLNASGYPTVYLDGTSVYSDSSGAPRAPGSIAGANDTQIGGYTGSGSENRHAQAVIADVQVYNRALSASEIIQIKSAPASVTSGEVGFWPLMGGTTEVDRSGQGNAGSLVGATISSLSPSTTILTAGYNTPLTSLTATGNAITINGITTTGAQSYTGSSTVTLNGPVTTTSNGAVTVTADSAGSGSGTLTTNAGATISSGSGAITLSGADIALGASVTGTGTLTIKPSTAARNITIGDDNASDFSLNPLELSYLTAGFSSVTIGRASDGTGIVTLYPVTVNSPTTIVAGSINVTRPNSLSFNGTSDYVDITSFNGFSSGQSMTLAAWVRPTTLDGTVNIILNGGRSALGACGAEDCFFRLEIDTNNKFLTRYADGTTSATTWINNTAESTTTPQANTWYYVVSTYDGSNAKLYVNGTLQATTALTTTTGVPSGVTIGKFNGASGYEFPGNIADVQIFNTALNASQISSLYANPGAVTSNLIGYWPLSSASSVTDFSGKGNNGTVSGASANSSAPAVTVLNAGSASPITLTARTGAIQGSGAGTDVKTGTLTATAVTGIGSSTQLVTSGVTSGSASTSGGGAAAINIANSSASATTISSLATVGANAPITWAQTGGGALTVTSATTTDGAITLSNAAAALTATTVTAGGTSRNISLTTTTSGTLTAGTLTATGDTITLTGAGSIVDTGAITAGLILGQAATNVTLNGTVSATGAGDSLVLVAGGNFINNTGASALNAGAGRWLVYSTDPALDTRGGLLYNFKQYNATYGVTVVLGTGNGFLYTIAPSITPSLIGTVTKGYDGTITATLAGGNYAVSGAIDGDTVTLNNPSGSYDTANVGVNKNVAVAGLAIASATNGAATVYGYQLGSTTANANIGTITAKALTITAQTNSKTYDSTTSAAAVPVVVGLVGSDTVTGKAETYDTANVGAGKTLSVSAYTVNDGNGGGNYTVTTVADVTGAISAKALTITAQTNSKTYDSTTSAAAVPVVVGLVGSDTVTGKAETYDTANVGAGKTLSVSAYTVNDGNGGGNYTVTTVADVTGAISAKALTITAQTNSKTYDSTTSAAAVPVVVGLVGSDTVTGKAETYDTANVGAGKTLSVSAYTVNDGNSGNNYTVTTVADVTGAISAKALTITAQTNSKTYDSTTSAAAVPVVVGLVGSDTVTGKAETYDTANVGAGKTLSVSAYTVNDGNGGGNYTVTTVADVTGAISAKALTITAQTNSKTYDSTTSAAAVPVVVGLVGSDTVTGKAETYDTANVGAGKTLSVSAYTVNDGNGGGNYTVTTVADVTGAISAKALTITAQTNSKTYDSTTSAAAVPVVVGLVGSDTVTGKAETYDTANVGAGKTLSVSAYTVNDGNGGGNYTVTTVADVTGAISAKALTITAQTNSKTYDSTTSAAAVPVVVGLVGSDTVTGKAETYDTANVGAGKTLSVSAYTVNDGNSGNNYTVTTVADVTGAISKAGLTVNGVLANNKAYDGNTVATLTTGAASVTPLGADMVTLSSVGATGAFADPNVGVGKPVTVMGFTIGGADAGNYMLTQPAGLTADITAALVVNAGLPGNVLYLLAGGQAQLLTSGILPDHIYNCLSLGRKRVACTAGAMWQDDDGGDGPALKPAAEDDPLKQQARRISTSKKSQ